MSKKIQPKTGRIDQYGCFCVKCCKSGSNLFIYLLMSHSLPTFFSVWTDLWGLSAVIDTVCNGTDCLHTATDLYRIHWYGFTNQWYSLSATDSVHSHFSISIDSSLILTHGSWAGHGKGH